MTTLRGKSRTLKVLVAEDDRISQKLLFMLLKKLAGCEPDLAGTADEVSAFVREKDYDLIFMDYNMPGSNGAEVVRMIRNDPRIVKQPYIVGLSAMFGDRIQEFESAGLDHFIGKPVTIQNLKSVLSS